MALSEDLKVVYSSNTYDIQAYDTIELSHSMFTKTYYYVKNSFAIQKITDEVGEVTFEPLAFSIQPPTKGADQQDIQFVFDNTLGNGFDELEKAATKMNEPIVLKYRVFVENLDTQQMSTIVLALINITATPSTVSALASRTSLYARKVPKRTYEPWVFKGLQ